MKRKIFTKRYGLWWANGISICSIFLAMGCAFTDIEKPKPEKLKRPVQATELEIERADTETDGTDGRKRPTTKR